jgi:hypothetical protein
LSLVGFTSCIARIVRVVIRWLIPHHVVGIEVMVIIELDIRDGEYDIREGYYDIRGGIEAVVIIKLLFMLRRRIQRDDT